eukprot:775101-Pyramimonas_sp.AAC.1
MACSVGGVRGLMSIEKEMMAWSLRRLSGRMPESCSTWTAIESSCVAWEGRLMNARSMDEAVQFAWLKRV